MTCNLFHIYTPRPSCRIQAKSPNEHQSKTFSRYTLHCSKEEKFDLHGEAIHGGGASGAAVTIRGAGCATRIYSGIRRSQITAATSLLRSPLRSHHRHRRGHQGLSLSLNLSLHCCGFVFSSSLLVRFSALFH